MDREILEQVEREVLLWPGVGRDPERSRVSLYRFGGRQIGHVHHDGVADIPFSKAVHDELISTGKAEPHRGGFPAVVSYGLHTPEDVPGAIELFRLSYERAKESAKRRAERRKA
ncbi:MAG: luciferase family protein [Rubrobacteraceae bacterium]